VIITRVTTDLVLLYYFRYNLDCYIIRNYAAELTGIESCDPHCKKTNIIFYMNPRVIITSQNCISLSSDEC